MPDLSVFEKLFTVVGHEHDQSPFDEPALFEGLEELSEPVVEEADLLVVEGPQVLEFGRSETRQVIERARSVDAFREPARLAPSDPAWRVVGWFELRLEPRGWPIRFVWIQIVEVEEEGLGEGVEPRHRLLVHAGRSFLEAGLVEVVEAGVEATLSIDRGRCPADDQAAGDRGGVIALGLQDLGERRVIR